MATVNSASFTADFALKVQGDTAKMTDPTAKALLSQGVTVPRRGRERQRPHRRRHDDEPRHRRPEPRVRHDERGQEVVARVPGHLVRARRQELQGAGQAGRRPAPRPPSSSRAWASTPRAGARSTSSWAPRRWTTARRGLPRQGRRRPAEARGVADQGGRGPEPPGASSAAPAASSGSSARASRRTSSRPRSWARASRTPPWTTGSASTTSYMYKAQFAASMDTSGQKDMEGVTGVTMDGTVTHGRLRRAGRGHAAGRREVVQRVHEPAVRRDDGRQRMTF